MRPLGTLLLCALCAATAQAQEVNVRELGASVVQVLATLPSGRIAFGSGVVIEREKLLTNCHVVRGAREVQVASGARRWRADHYAGDGVKDLCILVAPGLDAPAAKMGGTGALRLGESVYAIGYPGGGPLNVGRGRVESLYRFDGARVIQTSAPFEEGASGGALFTAGGRLVGILTFKAPAGGAFHFAIPVDWTAGVEAARYRGGAPHDEQAFFERDLQHRPQFLRAVWYESTQQWSTLLQICEHWTNTEPGNQDARLAMTRALDRLLHPVSGHAGPFPDRRSAH
jgi:hypothetical protein